MDAAAVMLGVANGSLPLDQLDSIGQRLGGRMGFRILTPPKDSPVVPVAWADLAKGFLTHLGKASFEEWASFVVMAEFDYPTERTDDDGVFLESLHDAANGWPLRADAQDIAQRLAS
jgi:hypothetical protein